MRKNTTTYRPSRWLTAGLAAALSSLALPPATLRADETCASPYMAKITGQEDFVYIWTWVRKASATSRTNWSPSTSIPSRSKYGKVVSSLSVGGRNEAHHSDFTDDRKYLWAGGLDTSKIFIFDVATDPAKPKLAKTITDFVAKSGGVVGPHTSMPCRGG